jgi:sulfane dehydrogenase subunit SoxC
MYGATPPALTCGQVHGMVSCSEWTGVPLGPLEEAGADLSARWILAEGADSAHEPQRADGQGPGRRLPCTRTVSGCGENATRCACLPGYEGNMNVKWLRRIKAANAHHDKGRDFRHTDLQADGAHVYLPDRGEVGDHAPSPV